MAAAVGPTKTIPRRSHSSANSACSATNPQPTQAASARASTSARSSRPIVQVAALHLPVALVPEGGRAQAHGVVGVAHEHGAPVGLGVQGDGGDGAVLLPGELPHGVDEAHRALPAVDDGHSLEGAVHGPSGGMLGWGAALVR